MRRNARKVPAQPVRAARVRSIDEGERRISAVASTEAVDSWGTILRSNWDLERFNANPVLLFAHNDQILPVGHCENVRVENKELLFDAVIDEITELDQQVWAKYQSGALRGFSVRFDPLERRVIQEGGRDVIEYTRSTLLEISCVPVPANPEALRRSAGHERGDMKKSAFMKALKARAEGEGSDEEKAKAAELYKSMGGDDACKAAEDEEAKAEGDEDDKEPESKKEPEAKAEGDEDDKEPESKKEPEAKAAPRAAAPKLAKPKGGAVDLAVRVAELEAAEQRRAVQVLVDGHKDRFTASTRAWALGEPLEVVERYLKRAPKIDARTPQAAPPTRGAGQVDGAGAGGIPPQDAAKLDRILGITRTPEKLGWGGYDPDAGVVRFHAADPAKLRQIRADRSNGRTTPKEG